MEYLEGQTLAERLLRGPLPIAEALEYGAQLADALAKAHRQGIVHRDLKPGNVMLTKSGAKLLDFGLARLTQASSGTGASATLSATGTVVGTVPYMAPEQVEGRATDARTDIFAFGAVLYEMLTGKRAFQGESPASVAAAILEHDPPPLSSLQPLTPLALERVVRKCLQKDPDTRWQSASDLRDELRWLTGSSDTTSAIPGPATATPCARRARWPIALAIAAVAAVSAVGGGAVWPMLTSTPVRPLPVALDLSLEGTGLAPPSDVAVSPDGTVLVFASTDGKQPRLYARNIREREIKPLEGTEDASVPCFSPDGASVAFMSPKGLQRVPVAGGPPFVIYANAAGVVGHAGMTWGADERIVFVRQMEQGRATLWRVPAKGGPREMLMQSDGRDAGIRYFWPQMLPGGRAVLFTIAHRGHATVAVFLLDTHTFDTLFLGPSG
jgi:serine/threonine-protein kinase